MVDALVRGGGRFAGVAMIDDSHREADLEHMHDAGVRGIRFNFVGHLGGAPDIDLFWRLVARVAPHAWHVELHFDAASLADHLSLFEDLPVPFIIDHMARVRAADGTEQEPFQLLLEILSENSNAWVKISGAERITREGPPYGDVVPFARELIETAPDRVLWGTDWPHPNVRRMPDDGDLVDLVADFVPDEKTRDRILVENPTRLYDFSDR